MRVGGLASRSPRSQAAARERFPDIPIRESTDLVQRVDCLIVAVPDDAIYSVVKQLSDNGALHAGQYVIHVSGCHGLSALQSGVDIGAVPFALHPAMTFAGLSDDAARFTNTPFGITTWDTHREQAEEFVDILGGSAYWIPDDKRMLYHSGLVFGANNLISLISGAFDILSAVGIDEPAQLAAPMLQACLDNVIKHHDQALTGPVRRGDLGTIRAHVSALQTYLPDGIRPYLEFASYTAQRAREKQLNSPEILDIVIAQLSEIRQEIDKNPKEV